MQMNGWKLNIPVVYKVPPESRGALYNNIYINISLLVTFLRQNSLLQVMISEMNKPTNQVASVKAEMETNSSFRNNDFKQLRLRECQQIDSPSQSSQSHPQMQREINKQIKLQNQIDKMQDIFDQINLEVKTFSQQSGWTQSTIDDNSTVDKGDFSNMNEHLINAQMKAKIESLANNQLLAPLEGRKLLSKRKNRNQPGCKANGALAPDNVTGQSYRKRRLKSDCKTWDCDLEFAKVESKADQTQAQLNTDDLQNQGHFEQIQTVFEQSKCRFCEKDLAGNYLFKNKYEYKSHLQINHDKWPCQSCDSVFLYEKQRTRHRKKDSCKGQAHCEKCSTKFMSRNEERQHKQISESSSCLHRCPVAECTAEVLDIFELSCHLQEEHIFLSSPQISYSCTPRIKNKDLQSDKFFQSCIKLNVFEHCDISKERAKQHLRSQKNKKLLAIQQNQVIRAYDYHLVSSKYERAALMNIDNDKIIDHKQLALMIDELIKDLKKQRVTQIWLQVDISIKPIAEQLGFVPIETFQLSDMFKGHQKVGSNSQFMKRYMPDCISDLIPKVIAPITPLGSPLALKVEEIKNIWREVGLTKVLHNHIQMQKSGDQKRQNKNALPSDQAETPDEVFDLIYNKILISKKQFWDPCVYQPNWKASTHFNGLTEPWHGDFVFCNPPYSIGAKFVSKSILEFISGKNVVLLIPQQTAEGSFGRKYLKKIGEIQHLGQIRFKNFQNKLMTPVSLVYLLQPVYIQYLKTMVNTINSRTDGEEIKKSSGLMAKYSTLDQRKDIAKTLLAARKSIEYAREQSGLSQNKIVNLKRLLILEYEIEQCLL